MSEAITKTTPTRGRRGASKNDTAQADAPCADSREGLLKSEGGLEPLPSILDLGRRIVALSKHLERLSEEEANLPEPGPGTPQEQYFRRHELEAAKTICYDREDALADLALGLRPRTMADAAVLLALGWRQHVSLDRTDPDAFDTKRMNRQIQHALLSSLSIVAPAAGIAPNDTSSDDIGALDQE